MRKEIRACLCLHKQGVNCACLPVHVQQQFVHVIAIGVPCDFALALHNNNDLSKKNACWRCGLHTE